MNRPRPFAFGVLVVLVLGGILAGQGRPVGKYRKKAKARVLQRWKQDLKRKVDLVPLMDPLPADKAAPVVVDFSGRYRFGKYDYKLEIQQSGNRVRYWCSGVDEQDIGGAFQTVGEGVVSGGRIRGRWWCFDLSRNYANTGGAEIWFDDKERNWLRVRYYHDADEKIEEGYGVRMGVETSARPHYRVRIPQPRKKIPEGRPIQGTVRGRSGEVIEDAVVMFRHNEASAVRTDAKGRFTIVAYEVPAVLMLSAAAPGYRNVTEALLLHEERPVEFVLDEMGFEDDPRYRFIDPTRRPKGNQIWNCGNCHRTSWEEWKGSRHAQSAKNPVLHAVYERDFLPALERGEAVGDPGLCSACHAPEAALQNPKVKITEVAGTALHGNHCDFCHKIHHVEELQKPGVRGSLVLARPNPDDTSIPGPIKRVFGTLVDSDYLFMGPSYSPFHATGMLCGGCHQYTSSNGIPALATYEEWKNWSQEEKRHRSCQDCHMETGRSREFGKQARRICINALRRPPEQIHYHGFEGREKGPAALKLKTRARRNGNSIEVESTLTPEGVGHKFPTGSADKHLLLIVVATGADGRLLKLEKGPRVPDHAGGTGDPLAVSATEALVRRAKGDYAGFAGEEFAQVLQDAKGRTHVPFWRAVKVLRDTRLEPRKDRKVQHTFTAPPAGEVTVQVLVVHRLRFKKGDHAAHVKETRPLDLTLALQTIRLE